MKRRIVLAAVLLPALLACASAPEANSTPSFQSERIDIVTRGNGPDVILIHGMSSHRDIWTATADALDDDYRLHLVQIRGFGGIAPRANADGPVSAPVAEEIARYISETGLRRPAVIGHSMGGTIAMMLTSRHPERVGRLMVVDMAPFMGAMFGGPAATPERVAPIAENIRAQMRAAPQGQVTPMMEQTINSMVGTEDARPAILGHARDSVVAVSANAFHELIVTDLRPEIATVRQPFVVLYVVPPNLPMPAEAYDNYMRTSYAGVPHARIVRIQDSRHFIMIDQFETFLAEVRTFLATSD